MSEFKKALEKYAKYVIQQSRSNLTKKKNNASKQLYNSLEYKIQGDKISFLSEKYGEFIDKGVKGSNLHILKALPVHLNTLLNNHQVLYLISGVLEKVLRQEISKESLLVGNH